MKFINPLLKQAQTQKFIKGFYVWTKEEMRHQQ